MAMGGKSITKPARSLTTAVLAVACLRGFCGNPLVLL